MKQEYKICLIGDSAVGKTTYMKLLTEGYFEKKYVATIDKKIYSLKVKDIVLNIWDCSGSRMLCGLNTDHYKNTDAFIFMFTNSIIKTKPNWEDYLRNNYKNTPVIFVKNKEDILKSPIPDYIEMSCKNNYNINEPIYKIYEILTK